VAARTLVSASAVLEFVLQPTPGNQPKSETPPDGVAETTPQKNIWRPLEALLKLRGLEALRYREFHLLWYCQLFTSMARGWLISTFGFSLAKLFAHFSRLRRLF
jgi:hypothetical protein